MNNESLGLFFDNSTRYNSLFPYIFSCVRESKSEFLKIYEKLIDEKVRIYYTGTGRSGDAAKKAGNNFELGLGRKAYATDEGTTPAIRENDILIAISGSGERPEVLKDVELGVEGKMYIIGLTSEKSSTLARRSNALIKVPKREKGELQSRDFYHELTGKHLPMMVMGSAFEFSALPIIDSMCYGISQVPEIEKNKQEKFFESVESMLYEISIYAGDVRRKLEEEKSQKILNNIIDTIAYSTGDVYSYGFRYMHHISDMFGTRLSHAIPRENRDVKVMSSCNLPKEIDENDVLVVISGSGETVYTYDVAKLFLGKGCKVFAVTGGENSNIHRVVGEENTLILPPYRSFPLSKIYSLRTFDTAVLAPLDCIAMETMRRLGVSEEKATAAHGTFI